MIHIDKLRAIRSAARRALLTAAPDYDSLDRNEQERFRVLKSREEGRCIQRVLLETLLDIQCNEELVDDIWDDVHPKNSLILNWALLLTQGIGEDFVYLNEQFVDEKTLLDFDTVYDYDYQDFLFQEEARRKDFEDYEGSEYFGLMHAFWIRLLIKDQFYYGTLTSFANYIADEIGSIMNERIESLIPHTYEPGEEHGKSEEKGMIWDLKPVADGKEPQLEELKRRGWQYQERRTLELHAKFSQADPGVYMYDQPIESDLSRIFIVSNANALRHIRWRTFLRDCEALEKDYSEIQQILDKEKKSAVDFIGQQYQDIMEHFDPKVQPLKKKRKIVVTPQALDDLNRLSDDDN